jgi:hypothetical protein
MANYSDWEIHSSNAADMQTAVTFFGFTQGDGFTKDGIRYTINLYGTKWTTVGSTNTYTDPWGGVHTLPRALPGVYAILRWFSPTPFPPAGVNIPPQVAIIPIPSDSPIVFAPG